MNHGGELLSSTASKFDMNGAIGGGQIGYNWQQANWVFGVEADIKASGQKGSSSAACAGASNTLNGVCALGHQGGVVEEGDIEVDDAGLPVTSNLTQKLKWFGTVRGRVGSTITPSVLVYATGGLAYGEISTTETVTGTNVSGVQGVNGATLTPVSATFSNSTTKFGWTAGAGVEGALGGNWTAKLEYLYLDLGTVSGSFTTPIVAPSGAFLATGYSSHVTDNIVRAGVNYRFGGSTLAKY